MYDFKNDCLPDSLGTLFKNNQNKTRQKNNLIVNKPRTNYSARLPKHQFVNIWNELHTSLQMSKSRNILKSELKTNILNTYASDVKCTNKKCPDCTKQH